MVASDDRRSATIAASSDRNIDLKLFYEKLGGRRVGVDGDMGVDDKSIALDAVNKEAVDLENMPLKEVFEHLKCTKEGLSTDAVQEWLELFGYNKLEEKKESKILKFLGFMWNPLSWVMEAAALMAIALAHGGHKGTDYHDFFGILILLIINSTISFIEENNAGNAAAALMARLAPKAKVLRDGKWSGEDASVLVPGDIVSIKLGDIVPADARLLEGDPLKIDQRWKILGRRCKGCRGTDFECGCLLSSPRCSSP